jgi:hypothetical protein
MLRLFLSRLVITIVLSSAATPALTAGPHYERPQKGEPYKSRVIVFVHGMFGD